MAVAIPLLIQVGIAAGTYVASSLLAPKPKLNPVDKGRYDDIRVTTAEEGGFIPLCFGERVRLAGNLMWGTVTKEYVSRDPGRTGGKGGARQPTPPTNTYSYKKSFAILVCATPVRSYRRISENLEVIFNYIGSEVYEGFFEAENHTAAGGATVVSDPFLSGGRGVRLSGPGQFSLMPVRAEAEGLHTVTVFYKAAAPASVQVSTGVTSSTTVALPATGDEPEAVTATVNLSRAGGLLKILRVTGTCDIDRVYVSATGAPPPPKQAAPVATQVIDPNESFPSNENNPVPYYNVSEGFDADGYFEGFTTGGGQARFELFAGKETQPQSAIIVAVEGASETPAFRDVSYFATEDYLLKEGQLGNFIFEIEPDIQDLDETLEYLYTLDGKVAAADCDFSLLAGRKISGLVIDHRAPLAETVAALEAWFNFDIVPKGGKITAVPRGGAVVTRLYERELRAHHFGEERPRAAVKVTHEDPADLPGAVDILYLDSSPSKDFHTGNQTAQKIVGHAFDYETLSFPIVGDANTAHAVGLRYLDARHLAAKPGEMVCGFGKRHLIPTDVIEVEMDDGTLYTHRIVSKQADLQGMVKLAAVPERASIYSQTGAGVSGKGGDALLVSPPANTLLVVMDCPALRQEDVGSLILYAAGCPRGAGSWAAYHLNKRDQNGETERVGGYTAAAIVGVVETASQSAAGSGFEGSREFVVKLYHGSLESRTEEEVRAERVNIALYGSGSRWEVVQFLTVEAQAATFPFVAQYKVTGVVSGLLGTEGESATHQAGDFFVLFDAAVASFPMRPADVSYAFDFIAQTAGQALGDAEAAGVSTLTYQGNSRKPLAPSRVDVEAETGLAPRDSAGSILVMPWPRTNAELVGDEYLVEYLTDDRSAVVHSETFREGGAMPALLVSHVAGSSGKFDGVVENTFSLSGGGLQSRSVALQVIRGADNFVEATMRATGSGAARIGLIPATADWRGAGAPMGHHVSVVAGLVPGVTVSVNGAGVAFVDYNPGDDVRLRIRLAGARVLFYVNYINEASQPVYESAVAAALPARLYLRLTTGSAGAAEARDAFLAIDPFAATVFSAAQQQQYYGGLKSPLQVRISQYSGVREVGYGPAWEGAI